MSLLLGFFSLFQERNSLFDFLSFSFKIFKLFGLNVSFAVRNLIYQVIVIDHRLHFELFKFVCLFNIVTIMVVVMLATIINVI